MNHTCSTFSEKVVLYLDGGLDNQQERELLLEMKNCPSCLEKYSQEKAFPSFKVLKIKYDIPQFNIKFQTNNIS